MHKKLQQILKELTNISDIRAFQYVNGVKKPGAAPRKRRVRAEEERRIPFNSISVPHLFTNKLYLKGE